MVKTKNKSKMMLTALSTASVVGIINLSTAAVVYRSFIPKKQKVNSTPVAVTTTNVTSEPSALAIDGTNATKETPKSSPTKTVGSTPKAQEQTVTKPSSTIVIGEKPKPTVVTDPGGGVKYLWCTGNVAGLEDAVCEAVISIAADPTTTNPHISAKAAQSLSLLPSNSTVTIDEASWKSTSASAGSMEITLHTQSYGDVKLLIYINKVNNIWVVDDGKLL